MLKSKLACYFAQTDSVGTCHRLNQRRKQVLFFIFVMLARGGLEVTQYVPRRLHGFCIGAMRQNVLAQTS